MRALPLEPDPKWLAERRRLGQDRFDEVCDGVLHVVPSASAPHQRFERDLERILTPIVEPAGLEIFHNLDLLDHAKGENIDPITRALEVYVLARSGYQLVTRTTPA